MTCDPSRAWSRGQAIVEFALSSLALITVILLGIHFGEMGFLSIKVQEAAASAMWDSTAAKLHDLPGTFYSPGNSTGPGAQNRYANFDGRTSQAGGSSNTQVFTTGQNLAVSCATVSVPGSKNVANGLGGVYGNSYEGIECTAQADIKGWNLIQTFARSDGVFFQQNNYTPTTIKACSNGRAVSGSCGGGFLIALDDWGLAGASESGENDLYSPGANPAYYNSVSSVYNAYGRAQGSQASDLAQFSVGASPIDENAFYMSYKGVESGFTQTNVGGFGFPDSYLTSPNVGGNSPTCLSSSCGYTSTIPVVPSM